ncbi:MAG: glycosyltransferase family 2 protein [Chthonomonadales bacterium]|nr:glycosyltransferase family 2 protein [Chthonomonadales bacterium]
MGEARQTDRATAADAPTVLLSVIMPVFNERDTVLAVIDRVRKSPVPKELIVVDDGSTDGTTELLKGLEGSHSDVQVCYHERNRGKGAAIRTAIPLCRGEFILIQDADLEYDPAEYADLLRPLLDGRADVVYGSRFLGAGAHRVHLFWHRVGNGLLTTLSNMLTNLNLTDMEVGYKVFRADVLKSLRLRCERFDFEPEVTARVARRRCRIYEVPISYSGRDYSEGKKVGWRDGLAALWTIIRCRFTD